MSPVGVLGVGERGLHVRPSLSKDQILQWLHRLRTYRFDESTELAARITEFTPTLPHRVLAIVLSDLHDPPALPALKRLSQQHDCAVLQLRDPAEDRLRGVGFVRAREAETGRPFVSRGRPPGLDQPGIDEQLKRSGIDHLVIETNQPFVSRVRQLFKDRNLLGRGHDEHHHAMPFELGALLQEGCYGSVFVTRHKVLRRNSDTGLLHHDQRFTSSGR